MYYFTLNLNASGRLPVHDLKNQSKSYTHKMAFILHACTCTCTSLALTIFASCLYENVTICVHNKNIEHFQYHNPLMTCHTLCDPFFHFSAKQPGAIFYYFHKSMNKVIVCQCVLISLEMSKLAYIRQMVINAPNYQAFML